MNRSFAARAAATAATAVTIAAVLTGCSVQTSATTPVGDCTPVSTAAPVATGGGLPLSKTVAPPDTSTSTVLDTDASPQAQCAGKPITETNNVVYETRTLADGSTYQMRMNISVPADATSPVPVVVYVPGGGFIISDRNNSLGNRSYVLEHGIAIASIEYRTIGDHATYKDGVADVKSAVRFVRAHAKDYNLDSDNIGLWGESAGAYLVTMAATTQGNAEFEVGSNRDVSSNVSAVVDEFGASDLTKIAADFDQRTQDYYHSPDNFAATYVLGASTGKTLFDEPAAAAAANPITYIHKGDPAFLHYHGTADNLISPSQTLLTHNALKDAGIDSTRYLVDGAGHGDLAFLGDAKGGRAWSTVAVMDPLVGFLTAHLTR
ncbi:alpha/beta hydrolase [Leifsonia aquatica]|uniref:alpha/beta hydrolase n=1 Tax=Leifsonia aquatica TaxID=144185 RepID=UPI000469D757|nr:alpha/beta hydrolase [Leifsonia aquatica]